MLMPPAPRPLRHAMPALLAFVLMLLAGCASVSEGSVETIRLAFHRSKVDPTPASVAAVPYFQLQVNAPTGEAILILAKVEGKRLGWYGAQHDAVFLNEGMLVKTVGLTENLDSQTVDERSPFHAGLQHLRGPVDYTRRMDWSPGYRYGVDFTAHLEPRGLEDVTILGKTRRLLRVDEHLEGVQGGMSMNNRYWVDPADGFIWKSRQHVTPDLALELIELRPYREAAP